MSNPPSLHYLQFALDEAHKCVPLPTAFCVGCVIVALVNVATNDQPIILATGFSRELEGNTHAEANALAKARQLTHQDLVDIISKQMALTSVSVSVDALPTIDELLKDADVYTTMEPCSVRLSGLSPCADALISARVKRCIIGVGEPPDFVTCEGAKKLQENGIEIVWMKDLEEECLKVARMGHSMPENV
jgi:pyrimidine deaminase RibD-like protein